MDGEKVGERCRTRFGRANAPSDRSAEETKIRNRRRLGTRKRTHKKNGKLVRKKKEKKRKVHFF